MRKQTFALMFHRAPKSSDDPGPQAMAPGIKITTEIFPDAINAAFDPLGGDSIAVMTNQATVDPDGLHFTECGTIKFGGDTNTLSFGSIGTGTLLGVPDADGFSQGIVMWKVNSGTGIFQGATGAITSNFLINLDTDELIDYHFYLLYLP